MTVARRLHNRLRLICVYGHILDLLNLLYLLLLFVLAGLARHLAALIPLETVLEAEEFVLHLFFGWFAGFGSGFLASVSLALCIIRVEERNARVLLVNYLGDIL